MTLKSVILGAALALSATATAAFAAEQTVKLSVPGMYCASCPYIIQAAVSDVDGVTSVTADLDTRTALVVFDDEVTSVDDITWATLEVGYESEAIEDDGNS